MLGPCFPSGLKAEDLECIPFEKLAYFANFKDDPDTWTTK